MKTSHLAGLLLGTAFVLAGCNVQATTGGGGDGGKPSGNSAPAAPAAPAPAAPANSAAPAAPAQDAQGAAAPNATVQGQARQNFTVNNNTGHTVVTLNVSPSNETNWGPDILGRDVLPNGQSAQVTFDRSESQCLWDLKATYDDGDSTDMRQINLCEVATVNLTP